MPIDLGESVVQTAERIINTGKSVSDLPEFGDELLASIDTFLAGGVETAAAGIGIDVGAEVGAVAGALAGPIILAVLLCFILFLILASRLHTLLRHALGHIPWVGGSLQHWVDLFFLPFESLDHWITERLTQVVHSVVIDWINAVNWAVSARAHFPYSVVHAIAEAVVAPVHKEVNNLWSWVSRINDHINLIEGIPTQTTIIHQTLSQTYVDQLHALQEEVATWQNLQSVVMTDLHNIALQVEGLSGQMTELQSHIYGARATNVGFQDVMTRLDQMQTTIDHFVPHAQAEIAKLEHHYQSLSPLETLVEAGPQGIGNLRKLEDKICQCPRLPNFGNELGLALGIYEFIEHG